PHRSTLFPYTTLFRSSQCLEHIILTENMIFGMIKEGMANPTNPERRSEIKVSDQDILAMVTDRSQKHKAPEMLIASGRYDDSQADRKSTRLNSSHVKI